MQLPLFTQEQLFEYSQALCKYRDESHARWDDLRQFQKHKPSPTADKPDFVAIDLHMPDESRLWRLYDYHCPTCGFDTVELVKIVEPIAGDPWRKNISYHIRCSSEACVFTSPSFDCSGKASQYWKCLCALSK